MTTITSTTTPTISLREKIQRWVDGDTFTAYLFLLTPVLILFAIKIYPVFYNAFLSFTNYELYNSIEFVGLDNYRRAFTQRENVAAIRNTLYFTILAVPLGTAIALLIAGLLNQEIRGRITFRVIYYLPVITSAVVAAMIWKWIYSPQFGILNHFMRTVGLPEQTWLSSPWLALPSLVVIIIWGSIGGNMIIFLAALQDIPEELHEAAAIDGAKGWQTFLYITVPLLRPVILFVVVTFSISIFRNFGLIFLLTQGGPQLTTTTLVWEVYQNAFGYLRLGRAAALAMVLLGTIFIITYLNFRLLRDES